MSSRPLDLRTTGSEDLDMGRCNQEFDNPFVEGHEDDDIGESTFADNTFSLQDQILAEEGRFLLESFMEDQSNTPKYPVTAPRPRTASEPMANPLVNPPSSYTQMVSPPASKGRNKLLSRRRSSTNTSRIAASSSSVPSVASVSSSASTTSSVRGGSQRAQSVNTNPRRHGVIDEESNDSVDRGARLSLDTGMAAVRRWIRSRSSFASSTNSSSSNRSTTHRASTLGDTRQYTDLPTRLGVNGDGDDNGLMSFDDVRIHDGELGTTARGRPSPSSIPREPQHRHSSWANSRAEPTTIAEERGHHQSNDFRSPRQRALSEPDAAVRDFLFQRALTPQSRLRRMRYSGVETSASPENQHQPPASFWAHSNSNQSPAVMEVSTVGSPSPRASGSSQLSSSAVQVLFSSASDVDLGDVSIGTPSGQDDNHANNIQSSNSMDNNSVVDPDPDPQREARARWMLINRRFQVVITVVALIFSLLLFAILVSWVVLTSAYVVSIDKSCDVPLKTYFWLATLQLILDIFRTDIMRCIFRWDANSNQRIPSRVITYNIAYLTYACLVLRMGIQSVLVNRDASCRTTASELFQASTLFVSLSIAAWSTIILGYLFPFCIVATLLTLNGYTPSSDSQQDGATGPVFPTPMGAPPGCIDQLRVVRIEESSPDSARECCICMEQFSTSDSIVETECKHRYHRNCLADWLRQARTCPVCRMDVVPSPRTEEEDDGSDQVRGAPEPADSPPSSQHGQQQHQQRLGLVPATRTFGRNTDIHHEVVSLFQIIRQSELRNRQNSSSGTELRNRSGSIEIRNRSMSQHEVTDETHNSRQY